MIQEYETYKWNGYCINDNYHWFFEEIVFIFELRAVYERISMFNLSRDIIQIEKMMIM